MAMTDSLDTPFVSHCSVCSGTRRVPKRSGGILVSSDKTDLCPACGLYVVPEMIPRYWGPQDFATSVEGARLTPRCWVLAAADYGSVPLCSVPAHQVKCSDLTLTRLALDLENVDSAPYEKEQWDVHISFPVVPEDLGDETTFPMSDDLWLNDLLTEQGLEPAARLVLDGTEPTLDQPPRAAELRIDPYVEIARAVALAPQQARVDGTLPETWSTDIRGWGWTAILDHQMREMAVRFGRNDGIDSAGVTEAWIDDDQVIVVGSADSFHGRAWRFRIDFATASNAAVLRLAEQLPGTQRRDVGEEWPQQIAFQLPAADR